MWFSEFKSWYQESWVHKWVIITSIAFVMQYALETFGWFTTLDIEGKLHTYVALKNFGEWPIGNVSAFFTYAFLHYGFHHFILGAIMLYFSGHMLKTFWTDAQVNRLFILGILTSGMAFFGSTLFISGNGTLMGVSGAVFALLFAATRISPQMPVYLFGILRIPLWSISLLFLLLSIAGLDGLNSGGNIAHMGGALTGWLLAKQPQLLFPRFKSKRKKSAAHLRVVRNSNEMELDAVLDKIGKVGYDALTQKEKAFLAEYGKQK